MFFSVMVLDGAVVRLLLGLILIISVPAAIAFVVIRTSSSMKSQAKSPALLSGIFQISRSGQLIGSYDTIAIHLLIRSGTILLTDDYWTQGMPSWQKVGSRPDWFLPSA